MKTGLILGKFMPVHLGHVGLVRFAHAYCDKVVLLLCSHSKEPISGEVRKKWLQSIFRDDASIEIIHYEYNSLILSDRSEPSLEASAGWAEVIRQLNINPDVIFSSEVYGQYLASMLNIEHKIFDLQRVKHTISASAIRQNPLRNWKFLPQSVQPHFVKKVFILGTESTGKSTLTKDLAAHFQTLAVTEAAREIIGHTNEVIFEDLFLIAQTHTQKIEEALPKANRLLFIDTDVNITKSYARFLFGKELRVNDQIEKANKGDLYLFLEKDSPFVQDGTRLSEPERNQLSEFHKQQLSDAGIIYQSISGNWKERFQLACDIIKNHFQL